MRRRPSVPAVDAGLAASISTSKRRVSLERARELVERGDARRDELQIHDAIAIAQRVDAQFAASRAAAIAASVLKKVLRCRAGIGTEPLRHLALARRRARFADDALAGRPRRRRRVQRLRVAAASTRAPCSRSASAMLASRERRGEPPRPRQREPVGLRRVRRLAANWSRRAARAWRRDAGTRRRSGS